MLRSRVLRSFSTAVFILACGGAATGQVLLDLANAPRVQPGPPVEYGTTQETFYSIGEWEFDPISSNVTYSDLGLGTLNALRYSTIAGASGFFAGPHLPDGAVLTSITYQFCDSNVSTARVIGGIEVCESINGLCAIIGTAVTSVGNIITPCAEYTQDISALNVVVNNRTQRIVVAAILQSGDTTNAIAGAIIGYKLQVSPPPATATFGDVPTSHPFFQFIEALAKSGVTGGCGGGDYCPDNPVTRGQMAVFLAKALGLQFP